MNIFDIEDLVNFSERVVGNREATLLAIKTLGEQLIKTTLEKEALVETLKESLEANQLEILHQGMFEKIDEHLMRYTTDEMKQQIASEGFEEMPVVVVDADYADEAIENGLDVYALKNGECKLLNYHKEASRAAEEGYLIVMYPYECEANDLFIDGDPEFTSRYYSDDIDNDKDFYKRFFDRFN